MAHCPPELLDDLAGLFAEVRTWAGVSEKKPGVFYALGQPFLHFHLVEGGRRRADIKTRTTWAQVDLPRPISATRRRAFRRALRRCYDERCSSCPRSAMESRKSHRGQSATTR